MGHLAQSRQDRLGVGSDDSHSFKEPDVSDPSGAAPGHAWIMVHAPSLTATAIRTAIERGNFYASTGVSLNHVEANTKEFTLAIHEEPAGAKRYTTRFIVYLATGEQT